MLGRLVGRIGVLLLLMLAGKVNELELSIPATGKIQLSICCMHLCYSSFEPQLFQHAVYEAVLENNSETSANSLQPIYRLGWLSGAYQGLF